MTLMTDANLQYSFKFKQARSAPVHERVTTIVLVLELLSEDEVFAGDLDCCLLPQHRAVQQPQDAGQMKLT